MTRSSKKGPYVDPRVLKKLEGKRTIIIATHNTDIVNSFQKRVLVLKEGKIIKNLRKGGYEL